MEDINIQNFQHKKKTKKIIFVSVIIVISFLFGLLIGVSKTDDINFIDSKQGILKNKNTEIPKYLSKDVDFKLFWKAWDTIRQKYIDSANINDSQMFYGAMSGIVASLNDPYSIFLPPDISKEFSEELEGKFEGIGAEIGIKNDILTIIAPLSNSPAEKAGLRAGDKILAIDGIDTSQISLNQAVKLIRGEKGTKVTLIFRRDEDKQKEVTITRDTIHYESLKMRVTNESQQKLLNDKNIAYIKITHFNQDTENLFDKAVDDLLKQNKKYIILDLRNNPGGYLTTAIKIASYWVENNLIVKEVSTHKEKTQNYSSSGIAKLKDIKTVVLVNTGSASASEIVAGALQDHGVATILGETTFGKGSVQDLTKLSDGSSIKLTIAKWLTPKDRIIDNEGIKPDIEIKITEDDYKQDKDPQLNKAIELLK